MTDDNDMIPTSIDVPLHDLQAVRHRAPPGPWRVRLAFVGPNIQNVSGESRKFWQITGNGDGFTEIRWGRLGSKGQSQGHVHLYSALNRAKEKLAKGYAVDHDATERAEAVRLQRLSLSGRDAAFGEIQAQVRDRVLGVFQVPATPKVLTLAERFSAVRWKGLSDDDELLSTAASLGWVSLDLGDDLPVGVRTFVGKSSRVWALRLAPLAYGPLELGAGR